VTGAPRVSYWELNTPNGNLLGVSPANTLGILTFDTSFSGPASLVPVTLRGSGYRNGILIGTAQIGPPIVTGSYSVTPSSVSGIINVASTSFAVSYSGIITPVAVTLSSNLAGTFSPNVINLPNGSGVQAFTYTPTVLGNHVISFSSPLTNPSPINYTSVVAPAGNYSVTPPATVSGSVNVASGSFTINASGINTPIAVTLSSSLGGTFSQSVINLPIGSSTQTFTYTPTVVGTHVISFGSPLTNPSPINYNSNPTPAGNYSITPPATLSSLVNTASGSFTITSNGINTPTVVTLSSNLAGTFSQGVINLPIGSSTQTFTYTPTVVGTHVISFSSALANPSPINYTASTPVASYSVTLPPTVAGLINVASGSFTINSSGITTPTAVTLSSNLAGTFSQSTINLPIGSSTQTFTYTPTVVGTHVISFSSSLTNPSPVNYTASSTPSGGTIILDTQFITLAGTLAIPVGGTSNYIIRHVTATANGTISFTGTPTQDMRVEIWNRSNPGILVTVQTPPTGSPSAVLDTGLGESKLTLDYDLTSNTWYGVITNG
jgi:hypothetical protein